MDINTTSIELATKIGGNNTKIDQKEEQTLAKFKDKAGNLYVEKILEYLAEEGFMVDKDPRLAPLRNLLGPNYKAEAKPTVKVTRANFHSLTDDISDLISRAFTGNLVLKDFKMFCKAVEFLHIISEHNTKGQVYLPKPALARVNPNLWGLSLCSVDGQVDSWGDSKQPFTMQSCSQPFIYALALELLSPEVVHRYVGCSGDLCAMSLEEGLSDAMTIDVGQELMRTAPDSPLINSGALVLCSLLIAKTYLGEYSKADQFEYLINYFNELAGINCMGFNNSAYISEKSCNNWLAAMAYYMQHRHFFPENSDPSQACDMYLQVCALETTTEGLSFMGATLASGGMCPLTGKQVLRDSTVKHVLALMHRSGAYSYSGEFAYLTGQPCKASLSGAVLLTVPGVLAVASYSPKLDEHFCSVRGMELSTSLCLEFGMHPYEGLHHGDEPRTSRCSPENKDMCLATKFAQSGDVNGLAGLVARGWTLTETDPMGRTILHVAAAHGQLKTVIYIVNNFVDLLNRVNLNGKTALEEAKFLKQNEVSEFLEEWTAVYKGPKKGVLRHSRSVRPSLQNRPSQVDFELDREHRPSQQQQLDSICNCGNRRSSLQPESDDVCNCEHLASPQPQSDSVQGHEQGPISQLQSDTPLDQENFPSLQPPLDSSYDSERRPSQPQPGSCKCKQCTSSGTKLDPEYDSEHRTSIRPPKLDSDLEHRTSIRPPKLDSDLEHRTSIRPPKLDSDLEHRTSIRPPKLDSDLEHRTSIRPPKLDSDLEHRSSLRPPKLDSDLEHRSSLRPPKLDSDLDHRMSLQSKLHSDLDHRMSLQPKGPSDIERRSTALKSDSAQGREHQPYTLHIYEREQRRFSPLTDQHSARERSTLSDYTYDRRGYSPNTFNYDYGREYRLSQPMVFNYSYGNQERSNSQTAQQEQLDSPHDCDHCPQLTSLSNSCLKHKPIPPTSYFALKREQRARIPPPSFFSKNHDRRPSSPPRIHSSHEHDTSQLKGANTRRTSSRRASNLLRTSMRRTTNSNRTSLTKRGNSLKRQRTTLLPPLPPPSPPPKKRTLERVHFSTPPPPPNGKRSSLLQQPKKNQSPSLPPPLSNDAFNEKKHVSPSTSSNSGQSHTNN